MNSLAVDQNHMNSGRNDVDDDKIVQGVELYMSFFRATGFKNFEIGIENVVLFNVWRHIRTFVYSFFSHHMYFFSFLRTNVTR